MKYVVRCVALGVATLMASFLLAYAQKDNELAGTDVFQVERKDEGPQAETIRKQLPHCGPNTKPPVDTRRPLVLVSTMDGMMMALDAETGNPIWKLFESDESTMLSSSLANMDIFPQIIPSLDGTLYKYDGTKFEALPVNAESLLSSSFKYTPDMVMSGGKEVITYGVIPGSGKVQYKCGMGGCSPSGELGVVDDMLIVERLTQTVRAIDPRTGTERWNFSVGQHNVKLLEKDQLPGCQEGGSARVRKEAQALSDVQLRMAVGKGKLQALTDLQVVWEKQLSAPIVHVWRLEGNVLQPIDIFDIRDETITSMVYVGKHNNQLYIQQKAEGVKQLEEVDDKPVYSEGALSVEVKKFPVTDWKPYQHSGSRTPLIYPRPRNQVPQIEDKRLRTGVQKYDTNQYPYDNPSDVDWQGEKKGNSSEGEDCDDYDMMNEELTVSLQLLSFWWKEILLMVVTLAVVLNLITQPVIERIRHNRLRMRFKRVVEVLIGRINAQQMPAIEGVPPSPSPVPCDTELKEVEVKERHDSEQSQSPPAPYVSRFLTDFEPVSSLGRGGFGVVFHAKNKLDDRGYAVKRIQLPSKEAARVKVMREVKTLAKLEHKNIVRYFSAWVEFPPPGWIQQHDPEWMPQSESQLDGTSSLSSRLVQRPSLLPLSSHCDNTLSFSRFSPVLSSPGTPKNEESDDSGGVVFQYEGSGDDVATPRNSAKEYCAVTIDSAPQSSSVTESDDDEEKRPCDKRRKKGRTRTLVQETYDSSSSGPLIAYQWKNSSKMDTSNSVFDTSESSGLGQTIETSQSFIVFDNTKTQKGRGIDKCRTKMEHSQVSNWTGAVPRMYLYIQMELCESESLADWLWAHTTNRDHDQLLSMFHQILLAVEYVHFEGLIHRDLKPSNVMFGQDHMVKVGDFGLVTAMSSDSGEILTPVGTAEEGQRVHTDQVGTRLYMSPELESGRAYNYKVDIFSLGMIFYELLVPFSTQMERSKALGDVRKRQFPEWFISKYPNEYNLLLQMLSPNPDERPTTIGVRALPPMRELQEASSLDLPSSMHYQLKQRQRNNTVSSQSSSN